MPRPASLPLKMTAQQLHQPATHGVAEPIALPDDLSSSQAKLVYLYLRVRGTVTVDELGSALGLPKLSLFSILQTLDRNDLVVRDGDAVSAA